MGLDEAGRGCLAGPVCSSAVIFPEEVIQTSKDLAWTDSKALSAKRRDEFYEDILQRCYVGVGFASVEEIDEINILQASLLSMKRALEDLNRDFSVALIDGNQKIPGWTYSAEQIPLVKGELRAPQIAAASIVAKVTRDRLMDEYHERTPQYGFLSHKGYGTKDHREAVAEHGPIVGIHRSTFAGVREHLHNQKEQFQAQGPSL